MLIPGKSVVFTFFHIIFLRNFKQQSFSGLKCDAFEACLYFSWVDTTYNGSPQQHMRCYLKIDKPNGITYNIGVISGGKGCTNFQGMSNMLFKLRLHYYTLQIFWLQKLQLLAVLHVQLQSGCNICNHQL